MCGEEVMLSEGFLWNVDMSSLLNSMKGGFI